MSFARYVRAERPVPAWRPFAGLIRSLSALPGVTRHSVAARGFHPQTDTGVVPPTHGWRSIGCLQISWTTSSASIRTDRHALAIVEVRSGGVLLEASVEADSVGYQAA